MKNKGFTLIEIVLVVVILSVLAAITIPGFHNFNETLKLKHEVNELAYIMRYAQSMSVTKNKKMRLQFKSDFTAYSLIQEDDPDEIIEGEQFKRIKGRWGREKRIPGSLAVEAEESYVDFYPDGTIDRLMINICREQDCFTLSTKEQRGYVRISDKWSR